MLSYLLTVKRKKNPKMLSRYISQITGATVDMRLVRERGRKTKRKERKKKTCSKASNTVICMYYVYFRDI